jgi:hypothetical protein
MGLIMWGAIACGTALTGIGTWYGAVLPWLERGDGDERDGAGSAAQHHDHQAMAAGQAADVIALRPAADVDPNELRRQRIWNSRFAAHLADLDLDCAALIVRSNASFDAILKPLRAVARVPVAAGVDRLQQALDMTDPRDVLAWAASSRPVSALYPTGEYRTIALRPAPRPAPCPAPRPALRPAVPTARKLATR